MVEMVQTLFLDLLLLLVVVVADQTAQDIVIHNEMDKQVDVAEVLEKVVVEEQDLEIQVVHQMLNLHQMVGVMMVDQMMLETAPVVAVVLEVLVVKEHHHNQVVLEEMV